MNLINSSLWTDDCLEDVEKLIDNENNESDDSQYNVTEDADFDDSINRNKMHSTNHMRPGARIRENNSNEGHLLDKQEIKKVHNSNEQGLSHRI